MPKIEKKTGFFSIFPNFGCSVLVTQGFLAFNSVFLQVRVLSEHLAQKSIKFSFSCQTPAMCQISHLVIFLHKIHKMSQKKPPNTFLTPFFLKISSYVCKNHVLAHCALPPQWAKGHTFDKFEIPPKLSIRQFSSISLDCRHNSAKNTKFQYTLTLFSLR